jgi:RNA polymerase sigma-70 factor (ECF subfamily)
MTSKGATVEGIAREEVVEGFYERIYQLLRRLTGNDDDAADLTQQTFMRAWQKMESFAGKSAFGSWIHRIAYNLFLDWRRGHRPGEERSEAWWEGCATAGPSPDETAARNDMDAKVYELVEGLETELRDTIHLHFYQELTLQETADLMEVALSTVKYRKQQALAALQKQIEIPSGAVPSISSNL